MKSYTVTLNTIEKVKEFSNIINRYDGDFDLVSDRYIIDAKSIMGIFSLDISKPLKLDIHNSKDLEELEVLLKKFM